MGQSQPSEPRADFGRNFRPIPYQKRFDQSPGFSRIRPLINPMNSGLLDFHKQPFPTKIRRRTSYGSPVLYPHLPRKALRSKNGACRKSSRNGCRRQGLYLGRNLPNRRKFLQHVHGIEPNHAPPKPLGVFKRSVVPTNPGTLKERTYFGSIGPCVLGAFKAQTPKTQEKSCNRSQAPPPDRPQCGQPQSQGPQGHTGLQINTHIFRQQDLRLGKKSTQAPAQQRNQPRIRIHPVKVRRPIAGNRLQTYINR